MPPTTRAPRNRALVIADLVVGIAILAFALVLAFVCVNILGGPGLSAACTDTAGCDTGALGTTTLIATAVIIFGFAAGLAIFVVRALQRRWAWFGPLIGLVVIIAAFYAAAFIAGQQLGPGGNS
ncbi:hypothetical protein [Schumannella soli]|uniref:hypothetical protein n=1 Tax=Schumannella soli TaxID=2590779 RepID=UPI002108057F|nr:hypothetical protein [Schumannella soli]